MEKRWSAIALWRCHSCGTEGEVEGVVIKQPSTPAESGDAEFYAYTDIESGRFFAGCMRCGSVDVTFDDVKRSPFATNEAVGD